MLGGRTALPSKLRATVIVRQRRNSSALTLVLLSVVALLLRESVSDDQDLTSQITVPMSFLDSHGPCTRQSHVSKT